MIRIILTFFAGIILYPLSAQLSFSPLFTDHMVIQRDQPINLWGTADPGVVIQIALADKAARITSDMDGKWKATLPVLPAGGPYSIKVATGSESIEINDVYIGDIWICSGQSNMEWVIANSDGFEDTKMNGTDAMIRHFKVPHGTATSPTKDLDGGPWTVTDSNSVGNFTAVGYYFAQAIRKHHDVAIGLLNTSWGGSRIEPWMNAETLGYSDPENFLNAQELVARKSYDERMQKIKEKFPDLNSQDQGMKGEDPIWAAKDLAMSNWQNINAPELWENQGYEGVDGIGWYRKEIFLTEEEANTDIQISLGRVDDSDWVWVNGNKVGGMEQAYDKLRVYTVEAKHLSSGKNSIVIRVEDTGGGGGIHGATHEMYAQTNIQKIPLDGNWKFKLGSIMEFVFNVGANHTPMLLYNKMIHPILEFPIKGAIWYQGESNAGNMKDATKYEKLFKDMISQWRQEWNQGDFPFLYVQLANFMAPDMKPVDSNWAVLRASQSAAQLLPNVGEAVIIDLGEADDIHPRNKKDVGNRLAQDARKFAYQEDIVYHGPVYRSHKFEGNKIIITFDQNLVVKDKYGYCNAFAIANNEGKFLWAKAIANGNQVTVWHDSIPDPKHVRYAWGNNPDDVNIYNEAGLPAGPFRTGK